MLPRTRLSLLYLAGYLIPTGIAFLAVPQLTLKLLLSNGDYGDVFPRLVGAILIVLGVIIAQIIRFRLYQLYTTAIATRLLLLGTLVGLYVYKGDPLFLVLFGVVAFGVVLTSVSYLIDRSRPAERATATAG
jgi:uncharacterized membrane protein YoaK (UPF0700 family)